MSNSITLKDFDILWEALKKYPKLKDLPEELIQPIEEALGKMPFYILQNVNVQDLMTRKGGDAITSHGETTRLFRPPFLIDLCKKCSNGIYEKRLTASGIYRDVKFTAEINIWPGTGILATTLESKEFGTHIFKDLELSEDSITQVAKQIQSYIMFALATTKIRA